MKQSPSQLRNPVARLLLSALFMVALLASSPLARAHIGKQNVVFEGKAGPYPVRVIIKPPEVVPGLADITVRVLDGSSSNIGVLPVRWDAGRKGAPPPDICQPVRGETNLYSAQLWLMNPGAYSIFVDVEGAQGKATTIVPLNSVASRRLTLSPVLGWSLGAFAALLVVGIIRLVGIAIRDGALPQGAVPSRWRVWSARIGMAIMTCLVSVAVSGGRKWWKDVDDRFLQRQLYSPIQADARVDDFSAGTRLSLSFDPDRLKKHDRTPFTADHGKLMHLFMVREGDGSAFAHLHPARQGQAEFRATLPALPAGNYQVYADVTRESGFTETIVAQATLNAPTIEPSKMDDRDDSWHVSNAPAAAPGGEILLAGGCRMKWESPAPTAGGDQPLKFTVLTSEGQPAEFEPYMGMFSHAIIRKTDGSVFTHVHPLGTISMTAQQRFAKRELKGGLASTLPEPVCGIPVKEILFPYSFPEKGRYRLWVQVKIKGEVKTGVFEADIGG